MHDGLLGTNCQVPDVAPLTALRRLELSYNGIKSLAPLSALKGLHLSDLYAASNRVTSVRIARRSGPACRSSQRTRALWMHAAFVLRAVTLAVWLAA